MDEEEKETVQIREDLIGQVACVLVYHAQKSYYNNLVAEVQISLGYASILCDKTDNTEFSDLYESYFDIDLDEVYME